MLTERFNQHWYVPELAADSGYESGRHFDLIVTHLTSFAEAYGRFLCIVEGNQTLFPFRVVEPYFSVLNWFGNLVFQVMQITIVESIALQETQPSNNLLGELAH